MSTSVNLPYRQEQRLREIARDRNGSYAGNARASTAALRDAGLIEVRGEQIATTGRRLAFGYAYVTDAGRAWLQANPR